MSKEYYYLCASLPMIPFGATQFPALEEFLVDCQQQLTSQDYQVLIDTLDEEFTAQVSNTIAQAWNRFEQDSNNEKAWFRAERAQQNPLDHVRGQRSDDPFIMEVLHRAAKEKDLLKGEMILARHRWDVLEEFGQGQFFNLEFLIVYGLKLKVLERMQRVRSDKGKEAFDNIQNMTFPDPVKVAG